MANEKNGERVYTTDVAVNRLHYIERAREIGGVFAPLSGQAGYYEVNKEDVPFQIIHFQVLTSEVE